MICMSCSHSLHAISHTDSLYIYFQRGYWIVDTSFHNNRETFATLISILQRHPADSLRHLVRMQFEGNASPDGTAPANARLSRKRAETVTKYLNSYIQIADSLISVMAEGIDWDGLYVSVERDPECPAREEILNIIRETPEWIYDDNNRIVDGRKKRLMDLQGGIPYNYMAENIFPDLRNTTITLYYENKDRAITPIAKKESIVKDSISDILGTGDILREKPDKPDSVSARPQITLSEEDSIKATAIAKTSKIKAPDATIEPANDISLHRLALKTNLLYDAILMPSLEIEYRIDDRWSVAVDGNVAWWKKDSRHKYYQIATITPEGRYWFRTKKPWHGHYIGVFAGGSWYDLENGARGYKGEFLMTGLSYGYMFPIGRSLSLEAGIGIGFLHTTYEEYLPIDGHYVYQQTSRTNWFGPVKVKFSLAWRLWDQHKKDAR